MLTHVYQLELFANINKLENIKREGEREGGREGGRKQKHEIKGEKVYPKYHFILNTCT